MLWRKASLQELHCDTLLCALLLRRGCITSSNLHVVTPLQQAGPAVSNTLHFNQVTAHANATHGCLLWKDDFVTPICDSFQHAPTYHVRHIGLLKTPPFLRFDLVDRAQRLLIQTDTVPATRFSALRNLSSIS